ncbi:AAA family ATPase [Idiomarina xiamenensis]|uniref:Uncharacterized protein n=1 Tax=Idiomarina xiamenensis 10-D-4 TaxID=740709 RepID=K2K8J7_9GAMM|nr:AAA family ATPase [Idiomarina xiamenensis]EKE79259.1 hypothetical protein A10D4_13118 [Idiomarina xiamenensis 10-D-4]
MIKFPVLRQIKIEDYQLYKNEKNESLDHNFDGGVHLVVGINGLGKTTLLNAIYRLMVGPKDPPKDGERTLGSSKNELTKWRRRKFFSNRVKDGALNATVEGVIEFGNSKIQIKRKLSNLDVLSLSVDGVSIDSSQEAYEEKVEELSGLPSFVDFFSVVKFLVFFLEDRSDLIWDQTSQFEMFRILFFDKESAKAAAKYRDEARSADSRYRNLKASVNKIKDQLDDLVSDETDINRKEYASSLARLSGVDERLRELEDELSENSYEITSTKLKIAQSRRDFDEYKYGLEESQHNLLSKYFPDLDETVKMLLSNLSSGGGCFVCGSKSNDSERIIDEAVRNKCCPVCHSNEQTQESTEKFVSNAERAEAEIERMRQKSLQCLSDYESQKEILEQLYDKQSKLLELVKSVSDERVACYRKVAAIEKTLPNEDSDTEELSKQLTSWQGMLRNYEDLRKENTSAYSKAIEHQTNHLYKKLELLKSKFEHYCSKLLAETVKLKLEHHEGPLGEGGKEKVRVPFFRVKMTSGVHTESPQLRESEEQVSESQREFIDLAFRLSLFDVVTETEGSPAMIVMETPEASLDSIFMHEISRLFRTFGQKQEGRNVFIASTNLNQSSMISSLLGVGYEPGHVEQNRRQRLLGAPGDPDGEEPVLYPIEAENREKHIINLLQLSAPNAALVNYRSYYEQLFNEAVYQSVDSGGGSS